MTKQRNDNDDGLEWVRRDIARRGAKIAYLALVDVADDKKAPSPARATAGVAIMRAAGLQDPKAVAREVEPAEMSPDQMARGVALFREELERLEKRRANRAQVVDEDDSDEDSSDEDDLFA